MIDVGDFVRVTTGAHEGRTGRIERVGISDIDVRLTSTNVLHVLPRGSVRRIVGYPVTLDCTQQRQAREGRAA